MVEVYTDGSCWPNPGPGGWAFVVVADGKVIAKGSGPSSDKSTNNRMELAAMIEGVEKAAEAGHRHLMVVSDSTYAIGMLSKGWKPKDNGDLVCLLRKACVGLTVHSRWVRGHTGNKFNEMANTMAESARTRLPYSIVDEIPKHSTAIKPKVVEEPEREPGHDGYCRIPLTREQVSQMSATDDPILMVDPITGDEYALCN